MDKPATPSDNPKLEARPPAADGPAIAQQPDLAPEAPPAMEGPEDLDVEEPDVQSKSDAQPKPSPSGPAKESTEALDKMKDSVNEATKTASEVVANPKVKLFLYLLAGLIIGAAVIALIYWLLNRTVNKRKGYYLPETEVPILGSQVVSLPADKIPESKNGKRQTVMFWIYVYDLNKFKGTYRHVWHRGDRTDNWEKASPSVYLDKETNKLHFTIGTMSADAYNGQGWHARSATADEKYDFIQKTRGVTIDYIPIQRWVHIAIVINEDVNNGTLTAYVDGELTKVETTEKSKGFKLGSRSGTTRLNINNANLNKKGNIYVGGSPSDEIGPGFSGLVSRIGIFNYDLNAKDIYNEYKKGPVSSMSGKIGYGVRTPVYRIG